MSENKDSLGEKKSRRKGRQQKKTNECQNGPQNQGISENEVIELQKENDQLKEAFNTRDVQCKDLQRIRDQMSEENYSLKTKCANLEQELRKANARLYELSPQRNKTMDSANVPVPRNAEDNCDGGTSSGDNNHVSEAAAAGDETCTNMLETDQGNNFQEDTSSAQGRAGTSGDDGWWDPDSAGKSFVENKGRTVYRRNENKWNHNADPRHSAGGRRGRQNDSSRRYQRNSTERGTQELLTFNEVQGDLFEAPKSSSLAHCVAEDLRMGSGIAVSFRRDFKNVDTLLNQKKKVGEVAVLEDNGRFIYYLITKKYSTGKPFYEDLESSLYAMRKHCEENEVKEVSMPLIGCGLDRLRWEKVRDMIKRVFSNLNMTITIYSFIEEVQEKTTHTHALKKVKIVEKTMDLVSIATETVLIYFGTVNGDTNRNICELNKKYCFVDDYRKNPKRVGGIVETWKKNELLIGLIMKEKESDSFSFKILRDCLGKVRSLFQKNKYYYLGFEAFEEEGDDMIMPKIITLVIDVFYNVSSEVWICWPPSLAAVDNVEKQSTSYCENQRK